ncbi:MAG TPA: methyltransferase domain-containing protein [Pyrinomonadaceae bacterium]|jgi:SAM-dependent methyltransferase|nr:methyltransferase domain-containing protein [Pyrinomonadaceae bacterium]
MTEDREEYTMGYGPAAVALMGARKAQSHAAFFVPHLKSGMKVLDCGCGPGSVTLGFAELVAPGEVVGTDIEASQTALATETAARRGIRNVRFEAANIYELPFPDSSFDAVFMSALIGNLREPIRGLREAYRVLKPGGVIGVKEFDHGGDITYPLEPAMAKYDELYIKLRAENGHNGESGRMIGALLLEAGFGELAMTASYEILSDPKVLQGAAQVFIGLLAETWSDEFTSRGWATADDIQSMREAWLRFASFPGALFAAAWCEAVAHKDGATT